MIFNYKAITENGEKREGTIDAASRELAVGALQRRGFIILSVESSEKKSKSLHLPFIAAVPQKEIVIMSRQISTLFEAQVSPLKAFSLLATNTENKALSEIMTSIVDDLQAGTSISGALSKHPAVFTEFYVSMVHVGEESGKLNQTFSYLADYLERQYELSSRTRNALIYPAFVILVFISVMVLMLVFVIPKLSALILESGQEIPIYTRIVLGVSDFFVHYGIFALLAVVFVVGYLWWMSGSDKGKTYLDTAKLSLPIFGNLYTKVYLSRIADNLDTMLSSGITIIRSIDITADVVGNKVYENIMRESSEKVKSGSLLSEAMGVYPEIPMIMVQMVKVGEETGAVGSILKTLARFYKREVDEAVDSIISLIEPAMIILLGVGVGILVSSVLVPIYNIASSVS